MLLISKRSKCVRCITTRLSTSIGLKNNTNNVSTSIGLKNNTNNVVNIFQTANQFIYQETSHPQQSAPSLITSLLLLHLAFLLTSVNIVVSLAKDQDLIGLIAKREVTCYADNSVSKRERKYKYPCSKCKNPVKSNQSGIFCQQWIHAKYASISDEDYRLLQQSKSDWCCPPCENFALPFANCSLPTNTTQSTVNSSNESFSQQHSSSQQHCNYNDLTVPKVPKLTNDFSIYFCNCRSILPKMDELRLLSSSSEHPDVIALCETWLDADCELNLPNYCLYCHDRNIHGGGVALYFHHSVLVSKINLMSSSQQKSRVNLVQYSFQLCTDHQVLTLISQVQPVHQAPCKCQDTVRQSFQGTSMLMLM